MGLRWVHSSAKRGLTANFTSGMDMTATLALNGSTLQAPAVAERRLNRAKVIKSLFISTTTINILLTFTTRMSKNSDASKQGGPSN